MRKRWVAAAGVAASLGLSGAALAQGKEVVVGLMCDRTGATQTVGIYLCPGFHDYMALTNSRGGVEGHQLRIVEVDTEYKVPQGVEAYERMKKEGAPVMALYGTPIVQAVTQRATEDKIPGTSPGFGSAAAADGTKYPYIFPIAASYWSQGAAAVKFAKDQLGGDLKGKKIAYLYYDNPAGKEPMPILEDLAKEEGFTLQAFAVPPPGVEMGAQALDIAQRFRADYVIAHLFGRAPSVAIKELKRVGYPLRKVVSLVWGASEADIEAAGGWGVAEGYNGLQFAGVGSDSPVHQDIREMYKKAGKEPPKEMASTVFYNRGVFSAAVTVEAIRNALKAKSGGQITGEDVKKGFESIKGFKLEGVAPPLEITAQDHEGGGWVKAFQVKGGKFVPVGDWFRAYPEVLKKHLQAGS